MPEESQAPEVAPEVIVTHEAETDRLLEGIFSDDEPETPPVEAKAEEADEELPEEPEEEAGAEEEPEKEGDEEGDEEAVEEQPDDSVFSRRELAQAYDALQREGWTDEELDLLPENLVVARGLSRRGAQSENDRMRSERATLSKALGQGVDSEAVEGQTAEVAHPDSSGTTPPAMTGADLTSAALPVAQKLAELDDPKEVAQELGSFVGKVMESVAAQQAERVQTLEARLQAQENVSIPQAIRAELGPDFEGDLDQLLPVASQLGNAGLHGDKTGIPRAVALVRDAQRLSDKPGKARKNSSTSRARKRGAAPPVSGRKTPPRNKSEDELLDEKIFGILDGKTPLYKQRDM